MFRFCATRWVEDQAVAERGIVVWSNMVKIVKHWESLCKSKRPKNKSYETLVKHHHDKFVPLRMQFFRFLAKKLKPFLLQFQSDKPLVPFLSDSLEDLLHSLMKVIVKEEILEEASTALSVTKIDVAKSSNQLEAEQIKFGTALKQSLSSMECRPELKRAFKRECKDVVVLLIQKLQERCPLKYSIVRNSSALSPKSMVEEKQLSKMKFQGLVERLCKLKWLNADEADDAKRQYDEFVDTECPKHQEKFASFDKSCDSVDVFLSNFLHKNQAYKVFWKVCSIIFVLSHGQSAVERGFSVNKELLLENLQEKSLVSQRVVYDHINSNNIKISEYELSNDLLKNCKLANRRYNTALEEARKQEKVDTVARKRKLIDEDIQVAKKKKDEITKCIEILKTDADNLSIEAEEKANLALLTKAKSFRKTILEKTKALKDLEDSIVKMEQSKKDLK